jgi:hypothetical protein
MIYTSQNGTKWYLHTREMYMPRNKITVTSYFFRKEIKKGYYKGNLPIKYTVIETFSGLPLIKKK